MENITSMHYTLRTTSLSGTLINAVALYDVYYDATKGIAYDVELSASQISNEEAAHLAPTVEGAQTGAMAGTAQPGQPGVSTGLTPMGVMPTATTTPTGFAPVQTAPPQVLAGGTPPLQQTQAGLVSVPPQPGTPGMAPMQLETAQPGQTTAGSRQNQPQTGQIAPKPPTPPQTPTAPTSPVAPTAAPTQADLTAPMTPTTSSNQVGAFQLTPAQLGVVTTQPQMPVSPVAPTVTQAGIVAMPLRTIWHARVVNYVGQKRLEYDIIKKIYYQSRQTIKVESALFNLQEDIRKFLAANPTPVAAMNYGGKTFPGYKLFTLTIWIDPDWMIPVRRVNEDRGYTIIDDFVYQAINTSLPNEVFVLNKPAEAIADFNLYPEPPYLPRFDFVNTNEIPQYGIYVENLLNEIKRLIIENQWEYGPFATILLPWLTQMPVTIYRARERQVYPPLVVTVEPPMQRPTYFFVTYDYLGYAVAGHTNDPYDLSNYDRLPIAAAMTLRDFVPLYQEPSYEKEFVIDNFITSVQSNDYFIDVFGMGGKDFDMILKNFSFEEKEGYLLLNVYGKEYWDNANTEAMFNYIITGRMVDAHTTALQIYTINTIKRLGIYQSIRMPVYQQVPGTPPGTTTPPATTTTGTAGTLGAAGTTVSTAGTAGTIGTTGTMTGTM